MPRSCTIPKMSSVATLVTLAESGRESRTWYPDARKQIIAGAVILDIAPGRFADLLSLFSPRVSVTRSVRFAVHYARTGQYKPDIIRPVRAAVGHYELTGRIRGPKTSAFARVLRGDDSAIVLDVWMAVALGVDQKRLSAKCVYSACSERIARSAKLLGWTNAETQASIWGAVVSKNRRTVPSLFILPELDGIPF